MNINLKAPKSWRELTLEQLRIVAETFRLHLTKEEMLVVLLCRLTGIRMLGTGDETGTEVMMTADGQSFTMRDWEIMDFSSRFGWLFDEMPCDIVNPTGTDGHMRNVMFGDWFRADALFYDLSKGRNEQRYNMDDMKQALKLLGDKRKPIRIADEVEYDMVLLWWNGVGNMLKVLYPYVFTSDDQHSKSYSPFRNLQNIHLMLNDGHPQDNEAINQCGLHDVLSALNHKIEEAEKTREALNRNKH